MILHFGNGVERFFIPSVRSTISSIINEIANLDDGKHAFDHGVFANVERPLCRNQSELLFESHERNIDIQMLLNGEERILVEEREKLPVSMPYDESRDLMFHGGVQELNSWTSILLRPGLFCIFFPEDAHAPLFKTQFNSLHKVVLKIPTEYYAN